MLVVSRIHGSTCRVYLGTHDISDEIGGIDFAATADTHDRTTFADAGNHTSDPGLLGWSATAEGFYDAASDMLGRDLESLLGAAPTAAGGVLSVYDGTADALGDRGVLGSNATGTQRGQPMRVADLVRLNFTLQGSGRLGMHAVLLHPLGAETGTGNTSSNDNAASSASGGRGNLHVTSISGTWTVKIQHSTDNSAWSDLITFTQATTTTAQTVEVTGTVNRYLRAAFTEDSAGTATFVAGFARY